MQYCLTYIEEKNFLYYSKFLTFFPQIVPDLIDKQSIILQGREGEGEEFGTWVTLSQSSSPGLY